MFQLTVSKECADGTTLTATDEVTITVTEPGTALAVNAGQDKTASCGGSVSLEATVTGGTAPISFLWQTIAMGSSGSVNLSNASSQTATATFSPDAQGTFTFKVTVTDSTNATALDTVNVTVSDCSQPGRLLVSSNAIVGYDGTWSGIRQFNCPAGSAMSPAVFAAAQPSDSRQGGQLTRGPDGRIYVLGTDRILVYDLCGSYGGVFAGGEPGSGPGSQPGIYMDGPGSLAFGPDGALYVVSCHNYSVLRYDGATGGQTPTKVCNLGSSMNPLTLAFRSDGALFVSSITNDSIIRLDMSTCTTTTFVSPGSGGLTLPGDFVFGPDGHLYVCSSASDQILRFNGSTGAFMGVFASGGGLNHPQALAFGCDGNLYVAGYITDGVLRYNGQTGQFIDVFCNEGMGGFSLLFVDESSLAWGLRSTSGPAPRSGASMAYDSCRDRTVLFGGYGGTTAGSFQNTWEWNGATSTWALRATTGPGVHNSAAMAFDQNRCATVLFGGSNASGGYLNDTWEWNGTSWTQRLPASSPSQRTGPGTAYDSTRGVMLLFGGYAPGMLNDVWKWNGTTWTEVSTTSPRPSPRTGVAMAYDPVRDRTIVFGGSLIPTPCAGGNISDETWELNMSTSPATWTLADPPTRPNPRTSARMVYDSRSNVTVLFGGTDYCSTVFGDTWEWNGSVWAEASATGPAARWGHAMAYDAARQEIVLFGGVDSYDSGVLPPEAYLGDTWLYGCGAPTP